MYDVLGEIEMQVILEAATPFEQFVKRFRTNLLLGAVAMCGDWNMADDLVQETLMIMHRRWDDIQAPARGAYARTVIAHLITHEHDTGRWERESLRDVLPEPTPSSLSEVEQDGVANRMAVKDALLGLPVRQRKAVYLRYWQGMSTGAIAQALHVPAGTVRSDLARATARLREVLQFSFPRRGIVGVGQAGNL